MELWENHNARALVGLGCKTLDGFSLQATELNLDLAELQLAQVTSNPHVVERSRSYITRNPADALVVYFALEGDAFFYHEDGCEFLHPGQALLCDADRPFMRGFSTGLRELVLKVPRTLCGELSWRNPARTPQIFDFRDPHTANPRANALARLIGNAFRGPTTDSEALETDILEIFRSLISGNRSGDGAAHATVAKIYIESQLHDPTLSAVRVAAHVGISERQLSRVFALGGVSVSRFILLQRLEKAHRMLTAPSGLGESIGNIAFRCGFSSQAYFSRSFKERFHATAMEVKRTAVDALRATLA